MTVEVIYLGDNKGIQNEERDLKFELGEVVVFRPREGEVLRKDAITELKGKKFEILGATIHEHQSRNPKDMCISYKVKALEHIPYTQNLRNSSYMNFNDDGVSFSEIQLEKNNLKKSV